MLVLMYLSWNSHNDNVAEGGPTGRSSPRANTPPRSRAASPGRRPCRWKASGRRPGPRPPAPAAPDAPDHGAVLVALGARQHCLMQHESQRATTLVIAAACPAESHLSHSVPLNPGESRPSHSIPLCPGESHLSHLVPPSPGESCLSHLIPLRPAESHLSHSVPPSPGESRLSHLIPPYPGESRPSHSIPLYPGESRFRFLPRARCRPWPGPDIRVSRGDSRPPPRAASPGRRPCRWKASGRRPGPRPPAPAAPDAPDHGAVLVALGARQHCLMQHESQRATTLVIAAACPAESHLSHSVPLNPGESRPSHSIPLCPGESHLSHLVPPSPGESRLSHLIPPYPGESRPSHSIPLYPGESRFRFLPRARCRPWPGPDIRVSRGDSRPPRRAASPGRRPCRCWGSARPPGGRAR